MRLVKAGDNIKVYSERTIPLSTFLGAKRRVGDDYITVEDNIVNRLLLKQSLDDIFEKRPLPGFVNTPYMLANKTFPNKLTEYQWHDIQKMSKAKAMLNRNPMGLGKTVETIIFMKLLNVRNALIVVPKAIIPQWLQQIERWWPEKYPDAIRKGLDQDRIIVTNYEQLTSEGKRSLLRQWVWDILICDEAHRIKNPKSLRTNSVKSIPAIRKLALTGTPVLNKPDDLWSILHFLNWRYAGKSYWNFVNYFCHIEEGFWGKEIKGLTQNEQKIKLLQQLLDLVSVYNPKDLAIEKRVSTIYLPMTQKQKTLHTQIKKLLLDELPEEMTISNGMTAVLRMQQVTSCPMIFDVQDIGAKFQYIETICQDNPDEKIVVFTKFAKTADILYNYLSSKKIGAEIYTGDLNVERKQEAINRFVTDPKVNILIGTIGAMGVGVDGLQEVCSTVIFIDRDWSPAIMKQCEDRVYRIGQKSGVSIYYLECEKSFDQRVGRVTKKKAQDIRKALME